MSLEKARELKLKGEMWGGGETIASTYALLACAEYDRICEEQVKEIEELRAALRAMLAKFDDTKPCGSPTCEACKAVALAKAALAEKGGDNDGPKPTA